MCEHQWDKQEHEIKKYGNPIYLRLCKLCGAGRALINGNCHIISPEKAKLLRTG